MHQSEGAGRVNLTERFIVDLYSPFTDPGSESAHLFPASLLCSGTAHENYVASRTYLRATPSALQVAFCVCEFLRIPTKGMLSDGVVASSPTPRLYCTAARRGRKSNGGKWRHRFQIKLLTLKLWYVI